MTGQEWFEFAAAIAGVSAALAGLMLLAAVAVLGVWRAGRQASDAQQAAARSTALVEDLVRQLAVSQPDRAESTELEQQIERMALQQRQIQDSVRVLLETAANGVEGDQAGIGVLEKRVQRLDTTIGQMATSLANLIRILEKRLG